MANFKISECPLEVPQTVTLLYDADSAKKSEKYENSWSTQVEHGGEKKWWNLSLPMFDRLRSLGAKKGDILAVTKKFNERTNKSYTDIQMFGDVSSQPQNQFPVNKEEAMSTREAIIRGQCFNNACTLLAGKGPQSFNTVRDMSQLLYAEMKDWLEGRDDPEDETIEKIETTDLPF